MEPPGTAATKPHRRMEDARRPAEMNAVRRAVMADPPAAQMRTTAEMRSATDTRSATAEVGSASANMRSATAEVGATPANMGSATAEVGATPADMRAAATAAVAALRQSGLRPEAEQKSDRAECRPDPPQVRLHGQILPARAMRFSKMRNLLPSSEAASIPMENGRAARAVNARQAAAFCRAQNRDAATHTPGPGAPTASAKIKRMIAASERLGGDRRVLKPLHCRRRRAKPISSSQWVLLCRPRQSPPARRTLSHAGTRAGEFSARLALRPTVTFRVPPAHR